MTEGSYDEGKGRAKKALGDLTDNEDLKREGEIDETSGAAKRKVDKFFDKIKEPFRRDA